MCPPNDRNTCAHTSTHTSHKSALSTCNCCVLAASPSVSMAARGTLLWGLPTPPAKLMPRESLGPCDNTTYGHTYRQCQAVTRQIVHLILATKSSGSGLLSKFILVTRSRVITQIVTCYQFSDTIYQIN